MKQPKPLRFVVTLGIPFTVHSAVGKIKCTREDVKKKRARTFKKMHAREGHLTRGTREGL